jgi:hypothetical protein
MKVKQSCIEIATAQAVSHPEFSEVMFHVSKINLGLLATTQILSHNRRTALVRFSTNKVVEFISINICQYLPKRVTAPR